MTLKTLLKSVRKREKLTPRLHKATSDLINKIKRKEFEKLIREELAHADQARKKLGPKSRDYYLHPSSFSGCTLATVFRLLKAPQNRESTLPDFFRSQFIFWLGDAVHLFLQTILKAKGLLLETEVPFEYKPLFLEGHADGILEVDGEKYVLEIKSINERNFKNLNGAKDDHIVQAHCYMIGLGIDKAIILYVNKNTCETYEVLVEKDPDVVREIRIRYETVTQAFASGVLPPRPHDNPNRMPCSFCEFSTVCWMPSQRAEFEKSLRPNQFKLGKPDESPTQPKKKDKKKASRPVVGKRRRSSIRI